MDDAAFAEAWTAGQEMNADQAIAYALDRASRARDVEAVAGDAPHDAGSTHDGPGLLHEGITNRGRLLVAQRRV
jgi:hypothetical protein